MTRLEAPRRAGGALADRDLAERVDELITVRAGERDAKQTGKPFRRMTLDDDLRDSFEEMVVQSIAEGAQAIGFGLEPVPRYRTRLAEPDDVREGDSPRTQVTFLAPAVAEGLDGDLAGRAPHIERPGPLGAVHLVGRD